MTMNNQRVGSPIRRAWWISLSLLALAACGAPDSQHATATDTASVMSAGKPADHLNKAEPPPAAGPPAE